MLKKLFLILIVVGGGLLVGVALYDPSIITNFTAMIQKRLSTGIPTFVEALKQNPLTTITGILVAVGGVLSIFKYINGIKQTAQNMTSQATTKMQESQKIAYDSVKQVEEAKAEYAAKSEETLANLTTSQELTTKLQIENDRLKRENEQLKTEYGLLKAEHDKLFDKVEPIKKIE